MLKNWRSLWDQRLVGFKKMMAFIIRYYICIVFIITILFEVFLATIVIFVSKIMKILKRKADAEEARKAEAESEPKRCKKLSEEIKIYLQQNYPHLFRNEEINDFVFETISVLYKLLVNFSLHSIERQLEIKQSLIDFWKQKFNQSLAKTINGERKNSPLKKKLAIYFALIFAIYHKVVYQGPDIATWQDWVNMANEIVSGLKYKKATFLGLSFLLYRKVLNTGNRMTYHNKKRLNCISPSKPKA